MTSPIKLVVGLGNPGNKYQYTRHNIGRRVVERLRGNPVVPILLPTSFMNDSGREVAQLNIPAEQILIVLDEFQIPLRQIKILKSGSDGGHNGMKSVIDSVGTLDVPRMRIGIGRPSGNQDPADYVLESFSKTEERIIEQLIPEYENAILTAAEQGLDAAMNKFNSRVLA